MYEKIDHEVRFADCEGGPTVRDRVHNPYPH